ncbi:MAG: MoaF C-terminal domain-containing protein [Microbacterium sp.]|uniref:MoaF C-terminal domain-containing protein n=1 Tax=Microbacterium sp. TaxID=51671 RepID=UPI0039E6A2A4
MSDYRLPSTTALVGAKIGLAGQAGGTLGIELLPDGVARWTAHEVAWQHGGRAEWTQAGGEETWSGAGQAPVDVVELRDGVFFVDLDLDEPATDAATVIVDVNGGWALIVHQRRIQPRETWSRGPEVLHVFAAATVEGTTPTGAAPAPTRDLVGKRHLYRYSAHNLYEHVYLNSEKFCSHNVNTLFTPSRADCHPASHFSFGDDLYVFTWREYDSGTGMVSALDLRTLRATAKAHAPEGWGRSVSRPIGGHIIPAGGLDYPDGLEPC